MIFVLLSLIAFDLTDAQNGFQELNFDNTEHNYNQGLQEVQDAIGNIMKTDINHGINAPDNSLLSSSYNEDRELDRKRRLYIYDQRRKRGKRNYGGIEIEEEGRIANLYKEIKALCNEEYYKKYFVPLYFQVGDIDVDFCRKKMDQMDDSLSKISEHCVNRKNVRNAIMLHFKELKKELGIACKLKISEAAACLEGYKQYWNDEFKRCNMMAIKTALRNKKDKKKITDVSETDINCIANQFLIGCVTDSAVDVCDNAGGKVAQLALKFADKCIRM